MEVKPDQAARLVEARIARGFKSARAAATYFGWPYYTYIQHEQGTRGISKQAEKYAKAFRVSQAWLLTGEGEAPFESLTNKSENELLEELKDLIEKAPPKHRKLALKFLKSLED